MPEQKTTAVRGAWVLALDDGKPTIVRDRYVVVEGDTIAAITTGRPVGADHVIELDEALVLPGFLNLHNHIVSSILFRGLTEDIQSTAYESELVYGLLMPLGDLATEVLTAEDMRAVIALGLLELIRGGTTTLMEIFRIGQAGTLEAARDMGLRFYGTPYLFSNKKIELGSDGVPTYDLPADASSDLERWRAVYDRYDGSSDGRIRIALGPHGPDSCTPDLLRAVRDTANELSCHINIHMAQSKVELQLLRDRHGKSPAEYLDSTGLLGPDVLVAHCLHASDGDLDLLKSRDVTAVNCPRTFARGGVTAAYQRFVDRGLRTIVATDGYCMDMIGELRAASLISKLGSGRSGAATAWQVLGAATLDAASALGRDDLGRIAPGARADLLVVDMAKPHLQPVHDPIKNFVWNGNAADISAVMVDGGILVEDGRLRIADETEIIGAGAAAVYKLWQTDAAAAIIARAKAA